MRIKHFLIFALVIAAVTVMLCGCGSSELDLEGKSVVTFQLQGGTLDYGTSMVDTYIKYAYEPNTYVLDPTALPGYDLHRNDYVFTGWYTSANCLPGEKWSFETQTIGTEHVTLYAGWERAIVYSFTVCYADGDKDVELGKYIVKSGDKFEDWRKFANTRKNFTANGYYADRALTEAWDFNTAHPGGDADLNINIYVNYIEGEWKLVTNMSELQLAISEGKNAYLMNNIDCNGEELAFDGSYNGTIEGNGYTVSNFKVAKDGGVRIPTCSIFKTLGKDAEIRNVSFTGVIYDFTGIMTTGVSKIKLAALALTSEGATVKNVTIEGKIVTNYNGDVTGISNPFFEGTGEESIDGFTANVTTEIQS